ncbi:hypothetical protein A9Q81_16445 [Gammaproteobacteria bacterium 42_54_T18]|nr:hypothetical protein A9Q81_16445 [Gammaproteobacteria bacterium 42_54_T18]
MIADQIPPLKLGARVVVDLLERHVSGTDFSLFNVAAQRSAAMQKSFLSCLSELQSNIKGSPYTKASLKSVIHRYYSGPDSSFISRLDLGTVNLVDAMFDEMLEKGRFDSEAWELIVKTKIPVLKLITQDLSFLFSPRNIARKFLNNLTLTLISSPNSTDDPMRVALAGFVEKIVLKYEADTGVVNTVCIDAQTWFAGNQQRLELVQEKVVRSESSKNKKVVAEPRVVDLINRCFSGTDQPELMTGFVVDVWRNVLRIISIEDGDQGARWKRAVGLTESMASFYSACADANSIEKYQRFLPTMMKSVRLLIADCIKDRSPEDAMESFELIATALVAGAIPESEKFIPLALESKVVDVYERKVTASGVCNSLSELDVGDWVRIVTARKTIEACRLTVKSDGDAPWIFINQSGQKIAKKTREELEAGLSQGTLKLIGKGLWVDDFLEHAFYDLSLILKEPLPKKEVEPEREEEDTAEVILKDRLLSDSDEAQEENDDAQVPDMVKGSAALILKPQDDKEDRLPEVVEGRLSVEEDSEPVVEPSEEELQASARALNDLQVGGWIVLVPGVFGVSLDAEVRLKLAVVVKGGNKYIFVNRLGIKQLELDRPRFVNAVALGEISIVDNGIQFSSALEKVVRNIQKVSR